MPPDPDELAELRQRLAAAEEAALGAAAEHQVAEELRELAEKLLAQARPLLTIAKAAEAFSAAAAAGEDVSETGVALEQALREHFDPEGKHRRWMLPHLISDAEFRVRAEKVRDLPDAERRKQWLKAITEQRDKAEQRAGACYMAEQRAKADVERARNRAYEAKVNARHLIAQIGAHVADAQPELAAWLADEAAPRPPSPLERHSIAPSEVIKRLEGYQAAAAAVIRGLGGTPFSWRAVDAQYHLPRLADMGVILVSKSHAERLGYRLKRGAEPVGSRYFEAPISRSAPVYVLEAQCVYEFKPATEPVEQAALPEGEENG